MSTTAMRNSKYKWKAVWLFSLLLALVPAILVSAEEGIESWGTEVILQTDGAVVVTENIQVMSEGRQIGAGIYRVLPKDAPVPGKLFGHLSYEIQRAFLNQRSIDVSVQELKTETRVQLKAPEGDLPHGLSLFVLQYKINGAIQHIDELDQLLLQITGSWPFHIARVRVAIKLPPLMLVESARIRPVILQPGKKDFIENDPRIERIVLPEKDLELRVPGGLKPREILAVQIGLPRGFLRLD